MKTLTRDEFLALDDTFREEVEIPEWGFKVYLARLSAKDFLDISRDDDGEGVTPAVSILVRSLVDEKGKRILTTDDIEALLAKTNLVIGRLLDKCIKLNAMSAQADKELEKN